MLKKCLRLLLVLGLLVGCSQSQDKKETVEPTKDEQVEVKDEKTIQSLHVKGTQIVNEDDQVVQLKGLSTHGLSWYPQYVNKDTFKQLKEDFSINTIRLAMYTEEYNGYCSGDDHNKEELKKLIDKGVQYAKELDMYVIIDWHILSDGNPNQNIDEALAFFEEVANQYKDEDHVLYEICNEPNNTSWSEVETYAKQVIPVIRKYDEKALIIVGTPTWSQDVDVVSKLDDENTLYALHFYADTHRDDLRNKLKTALDKEIPIFVSEFGMCDASGNGNINTDETQKWLELLNENHISYVAWNISNKDESSAIFQSTCTKTKDFTDDDYSKSGIWLKNYFSNQTSSTPSQSETTNTSNVKVLPKCENQWMENGKTMQQWSVSVQNNQQDRSGWTIKITFNQKFEVSQYWNFDYQIDGNTLVMTSKNYNKTIKANDTLKDLGMILKLKGNLEVVSATLE